MLSPTDASFGGTYAFKFKPGRFPATVVEPKSRGDLILHRTNKSRCWLVDRKNYNFMWCREDVMPGGTEVGCRIQRFEERGALGP
ncbi:hypothetical protein FZ934_08265 [Rhizobium grahamii]|uniref:Uncharacterized protein n=1 Tax=Rhizobium grahamii TaxID=1120045 RepID=A0A5Q0C910_9HYPH|nr:MULTISPECIES: hypothetical protein [Rhizobium]QFY60427.1 hypothetical protein FZ934_08265 [Rhizobium grahamii]QRM50445.1 hypothetical protein F3Y33_14625 [Rhizobium sp. BG6]